MESAPERGAAVAGDSDPVDALLPYVPRLALGWAPTGDDPRHQRIHGSLAFVDISGFTKLTERLARKGKVGAEEMSDILSATFAGLLAEAQEDGADLVKWGGDAVLLLFQGEDHAHRAARAAHRMRATLKGIGRVPTTSGTVVLRMSVGVHSGDFDFFLVGDPDLHRELLISGPAASVTAEVESAAEAGQIGLSAATAALLEPQLLGPPLLDGRLLRAAPALPELRAPAQVRTLAEPAEILPVAIRRRLQRGTVEPEHRLITVAFVQFSGTDDLLREEGPVALAAALDDVVRNVQHACADHDVTFFESDINRDGGKIMLTAGAPRSADHDEERMLRVARQVLDRAGRLPLRIGVNRGHVFAGDFGPAFRRTYSVKGDAINLAARVMAKALPGQVLATLEVTARSQTLFRTTELPPFMVKGKSQPVRAAEIGALVGARDEHRVANPFVGRAAELSVLEAAFDAVRQRRGSLVEVVGDPGIGKSRLVAELLSRINDVPVVSAPCEQYESSTPYFPFRRLVREVLGVAKDADADELAAELTRRVSQDAPHLEPWLPLLGIPLDLSLPSTRETEELDDQFRKARLEEVVTELLGLLLPGPAVVVIEDAHVADDSSSDLLQRIADRLDEFAWLVIVTRRDDPGGFAPQPGGTVTTLRPEPLDADASLRLVQFALEEHPLPPQMFGELVRRGGGNPMFLQALAVGAGRSGSVAALPESVEGLVTSQIDRLDPADRTVLRCAAVLGVTVDEKALLSLLDDQHTAVPAGVTERLGDFLARESSGVLRFRNALMRDVAYEGLPFRRRQELHEQVGRAIERSAADPDSQCELLSLHFFHAGRHERAWRYSLLAGERALAKYAHGQAIEFFARAAQEAAHSDADPDEVARVYEQLADSRWLVGLPQEAADAYALARRHLRGDPVRLAGIIEKEAQIDQRRRKYSQAMRRISRGLHELDGISGAPAEMARSLLARRYAFSRFSQGRIDDALRWGERAARAAEESLDKDTLAQAYELLNLIYAGSGRDEPLPYGRLALQAYVELGNLRHQGWCLNNLATQDFAAGKWDESIASFRQATDLFHRIGDTAAEANASYNRAEILVRQRRYAEAQALLPDVLRIARAVEDDELVALAQRELARAMAGQGEVDTAIATLHDTRARFDALGEPTEVRATDLVIAEVLQDAGRAAEAGGLLGGTEAMDGSATVHRLVARQQLAAGDPEAARSTLLAGLELAERGADRLEQGRILLALADLCRSEGTPDEGLAERAEQILDSIGVLRAS
ncbi:MAG TPA: adenylate/guanylate cyclase domain-containing protein [Marmoricola sp.]|nr:adenylate/guanylate cyclase domain-containing protein [Marmoricola sp.]